MAMQVIRDGIQLCTDCMFAAVNGDLTDDDARNAAIDAGLTRLGMHLVPDFEGEYERGHDEFSWRQCECCLTRLGGARWDFAVLGEVP